ncbi:MAG: phospholipase D family protein [Burkholderiales bacterium]
MNRVVSLLALVLATLVSGCASLPSLEGRTATTALTNTRDTALGRAVAPLTAANPGKTGVHAMLNGRDAFVARVVLAAAAEKSLDVQYYIWNGDVVGYLMFEALWQAAERGVRVRLLLDDNNTAGLDPTIAALDGHPNIEVRLYNPNVQRGARALNFLTDFTRVNHRMHNKSFTVDNQVAVVGGRNIGDEYFGAGTGVVFADFDVAIVGAAVPEVSQEFDTYWNSASAYPAAAFVGSPGPEGTQALQARFAANRAVPDSLAYIAAVKESPLLRDITARNVEFEWTTAKVVYDDPAKTLNAEARKDDLLFPMLLEMMGRPEQRLDLVSPYFVPGENGTAALVAVATRGVRVRLLTNSLASSDESPVQAGYAKRRPDLLRAGVRIYELKPTAVKEVRERQRGFGSSSSSGLHAKTFAVDGSRIFVGSFNLDQRSLLLNTEMGIIIASPKLAGRLGDQFDSVIPQLAYEVKLGADGRSLQWIELTAQGEVRYDTEPGTNWFQRMGVEMMSILPIEWLL